MLKVSTAQSVPSDALRGFDCPNSSTLMLSLSTCCAGKNIHVVRFFNFKRFTLEFERMSLFFTNQLHGAISENSLHRPKSYILPTCLWACVAHAAETGSVCVGTPLVSSGSAMSLVLARRSPLSFSMNSQSERTEVRLVSDTVTSQGF